eukprot:sb/3464013/
MHFCHVLKKDGMFSGECRELCSSRWRWFSLFLCDVSLYTEDSDMHHLQTTHSAFFPQDAPRLLIQDGLASRSTASLWKILNNLPSENTSTYRQKVPDITLHHDASSTSFSLVASTRSKLLLHVCRALVAMVRDEIPDIRDPETLGSLLVICQFNGEAFREEFQATLTAMREIKIFKFKGLLEYITQIELLEELLYLASKTDLKLDLEGDAPRLLIQDGLASRSTASLWKILNNLPSENTSTYRQKVPDITLHHDASSTSFSLVASTRSKLLLHVCRALVAMVRDEIPDIRDPETLGSLLVICQFNGEAFREEFQATLTSMREMKIFKFKGLLEYITQIELLEELLYLASKTDLKLDLEGGKRSRSSKEDVKIMSKAHPPELKKLMDKRLTLKLNANRQVTGILRGFDPFMNVVVDETIDTTPGATNANIGMVVIRGNSIVMVEALEPKIMSKAHPPELKKLMDKRLTLKLNANRQVTGILRGFDPFMNVVVDENNRYNSRCYKR